MNKLIPLGFLSMFFSTLGHAAMEDGKWGSAQVFDVQRSPAFPVANSSFTVSNMALPYDSTPTQYSILTTQYVTVEDIDPAPSTCDYRIVLRDQNGNFVREIQPGGDIYGLGDEGFLHVSNPGSFGTFFANQSGFNLGDSLTYTPDTALALCTEVEAYSANGTPTSSAGPIDQAPKISGTPSTTNIGLEYRFVPVVVDVDTAQSALVFSIVNKPDWMTFDTATGELYGIPVESGVYENIVISVTDGSSTVSLAPFSITVDIEGAGEIRTSLSGGAFPIWSAFFLGGIAFYRNARRLLSLALLAVVIPFSGFANEKDDIYVGADIGYARVKPDVAAIGYSRGKNSDWLYSLRAGYLLNEDWRIEGGISRVDNFGIVGPRRVSLDYNVYTLSAGYTLEVDDWSPYAKLGISHFDVRSASPLVKQSNDTQIYAAAGTTLWKSEKAAFLAELRRYSGDLHSFTIGFVYKFGTEKQQD